MGYWAARWLRWVGGCVMQKFGVEVSPRGCDGRVGLARWVRVGLTSVMSVMFAMHG